MFKADVKIKNNSIGGRQGLAYVFNSGKIKSVKIDLDKKQEYGDRGFCTWNDVIKAKKQTTRYDIEIVCSVDSQIEEGVTKWWLGSAGCCLSASFGFDDVMEMANNANLPSVQEDDVVALFQYAESIRFGYVQLFKVGRVDTNCQRVASLIPLDADEMKEIANKIQRWCNR